MNRAIVAAIVLLSIFRATPAAAAPQGFVYVREDENFTNAAFVRVSDVAKADLFSAEQAMREKDHGNALLRYQHMLEIDGETLVEFGARTWLSSREAARRRLVAMEPSIVSRYRELFGATAAEALERARATYAPVALLAVADRYPLAEGAVVALRESLALAAERQDVSIVRAVVQRLIALDQLRAIDAARALGAYAAAHDAGLSLDLTRRLAPRVAEPLRVGGLDSTLGAFVAAHAAAIAPPNADSPFASATLDVVPLGMLIPAERNLEDDATEAERANPQRDIATETRSGIHPLRAGNRIELVGRHGCYGFSARDGGATGDPSGAGGSPSSGEQPIDPELVWSTIFDTDVPVDDLTSRRMEATFDGELIHFATTRQQGVRFDRNDLRSVACAIRPGSPPKFEWTWIGDPLDDLPALPTAIDIDDPTASPREPDPPKDVSATDGFVFEGPPAIHGDLVLYTASRLAKTSECALFAFERKTGKLVYSRFLASAAETAEFDERNLPSEVRRVHPAPAVVRDGVAYVVTNLGIVAAVQAATGDVEWCFKYHRVSPIDTDRFREDQVYLSGGWQTSTPIVSGDRLIVTPEDSYFLYVLARDPSPTGDLILNDPFHKLENVALVAYDEARERLVFEAGHVTRANVDGMFFQATDLNGQPIWRTMKFEIEEQRVGRCARVDDLLVIPTTKRLLFVDLGKDGRQLRQILPPRHWIELDERRYFGNLVAGQNELLSASARFAVAVRPRAK